MGKKAAKEAGTEIGQGSGKEKARQEHTEAAGADSIQDGPVARLSRLRPQRRAVFLAAFLLACACLVFLHEPCKVAARKDCGYPSISAATCQSVACLLKDARGSRRKVEIKRKEGTPWGFQSQPSSFGTWSLIRDIGDGAVEKFNAKQPAGSDRALRVGDKIIRANGETGGKLVKALKNKQSKTLTLEIERPHNGTIAGRLPLRLLGSHHFVAQVVTSAGFDRAMHLFARVGGVGMLVWMLSGYPAASLPLFYLAPSGFVAWHATGCCYNNQPKKTGDPHCFLPEPDSLQDIVAKAWKRADRKLIERMLQFWQ